MDNEIYRILEAKIAVPERPFTKCQLQILKRIIKQKRISKQYFDDMLYYAFGCRTYHQLTYAKMYRLIHVLNNITTERKSNTYEKFN